MCQDEGRGLITDATVWVSVAALAILGELGRIDSHMLGWWLSERQLPNGGLNGRPEKLEDVCYSWWNLASLSIIGKLHWINRDKLIRFILSAQVSGASSDALSCAGCRHPHWQPLENDKTCCHQVDRSCSDGHELANGQDEEDGGIADRPGDWVDVFHTVFGLAGLSLLGYPGLQDIDPLYCMPADVMAARGLTKPYKALPRLESWPPAASSASDAAAHAHAQAQAQP